VDSVRTDDAALVFALFSTAYSTAWDAPSSAGYRIRIGREYTMALAFFVGAAALFTLSQSGRIRWCSCS
jgi:hypothetical protein